MVDVSVPTNPMPDDWITASMSSGYLRLKKGVSRKPFY